MTREEAIAILVHEIDEDPFVRTEYRERIHEALKIAIKALEQEPCEDAISRQATLDCLTATSLKKFDFILDARDKIKNLPPVTPQPKMGHWIYTLEDWSKWECSECGFTKRTDVHVKIGYKYCPNCGIRMKNAGSASEIS